MRTTCKGGGLTTPKNCLYVLASLSSLPNEPTKPKRRPPIPPNKRHRDRKNDHVRKPKHPARENG
jgi:hypothetical protein